MSRPGAVDGCALDALAVTIAAGAGIDRAVAELRRVDPLFRSGARRRVREAFADAQHETRVRHGAGAELHALRLAYLAIAGVVPPRGAVDDPPVLEKAYAEVAYARPPRAPVWWATASVVFCLSAASIALTAAYVSMPGSSPGPGPDAGATAAPDVGPPQKGAFADGGVPEKAPGDAAIARALGVDLPAFLVALDDRADARRASHPARVREAEAAMEKARASALATDVRDALGADAYASLTALLAAAVASSRPEPGTAEDALAAAAGKLDDDLAAAGLGFFVDADVILESDGRRLVLVYAFRVARVHVYASEKIEVRALALRRIDQLNWSHTLVGFTRPRLRAAAVLLDQVEELVIRVVAPALADGAPATLFDPEATADERAAVERRAGEIFREELDARSGVDKVAAAKLGKLLGERSTILARWSKVAEGRGLTLVVPAKLRLPERFGTSFEGLVPASEIADMRRIDRSLEDRTREAAFEAECEAIAASVERHEVEHRLDALRATPLAMPRELSERVGPLRGDDGKIREGAASARDELSAYLAQLARANHTPRLWLTLVGRFLFDRRLQGSPESYAALTIFEGLAGGLKLDKLPVMLANGKIDRRAVGDVWLKLAAAPGDVLRRDAEKLWEKLFGGPLPRQELIAPR